MTALTATISIAVNRPDAEGNLPDDELGMATTIDSQLPKAILAQLLLRIVEGLIEQEMEEEVGPPMGLTGDVAEAMVAMTVRLAALDMLQHQPYGGVTSIGITIPDGMPVTDD